MNPYMDRTAALEIAAQFLKQHFSIIHMDAVIDGRVWYVTAQIELYGNAMLEHIRIDAETGELHAHLLSVRPRLHSMQAMPN